MTGINPIPLNETERLAALRELLVLDSAPEPLFDSIAKMAASICGTPIALVSLVDAERQWFKANVGLGNTTETPREVAFCAHAILEGSVMEVNDATRDPRFAANPLVTGDPNIRFYAGAPLKLAGGEQVGTLCVIDHAARKLNDAQLDMLRSLAVVASNALMMRRDLIAKSVVARSQYEQALLDSESHYRAIVEDQVELISLASPAGELCYVNPAYAKHFGFAPSEMLGKNLFDFVQPSDRAAVMAVIEAVVRSGQSASSENRMVAADGSVRWVAWTNGVQRDGQGGLLLHSVGRDVSDRKAAEEALRASQSFLYRTGRAAGVGGWEVDLAKNSVTWSDETRRIHEVGPNYEPALETAVGFYAPEARPVIQAAVQTALDTGEPWDLELPLITAQGRRIWVRAVGAAEYESDVAVRLIGAVQDVTERKELEHRVASQTATLTLVTESIPATVAVVDPDGHYRFVNSAFERTCGRTRQQILGLPSREVLGDHEFNRRRPYILRALAGEPVSFELDYPSDEGLRYIALSYVPLRLSSGELDGFVVVTQDVTQQRHEALRLLALSQRDPLTDLLNRTGFEQYLEHNLRQGGGATLALLYIDLDGFKAVNDRYGHPVGDQVLKVFAQRLTKLVRPTDAVVRLGGDEFAVALAATREKANAHAVAEKILSAASEEFQVGKVCIRIGASIGVAFNADPAKGWSDLVERADAKLLKAKAAGKGRQAGEPS